MKIHILDSEQKKAKIEKIISFRKNLAPPESPDFFKVGQFEGDWFTDLNNFVFEESTKEAIAQPQNAWADWGTLASKNFLESKLKTLSWGYTTFNTILFQATAALPSFCAQMAQLSGLKNAICSLHRQDPGQILPWHSDSYSRFIKDVNCPPQQVSRILVFLETWKTGHFFQVGDAVVHHWQPGDIFWWPPGRNHLSCNAGLEKKLTLSITGIVTEQSICSSVFQSFDGRSYV
jgi:hypothetical protein